MSVLVVGCLVSILFSFLFLASFLLAEGSNTVIHQSDCFINICLVDFVTETEFRHGLSQSDYTKQSSCCDIQVALVLVAITLELAFLDILCNKILVKTMWDSRVKSLSMCNESAHHFSAHMVGTLIDLFTSKMLVNLSDVESKLSI